MTFVEHHLPDGQAGHPKDVVMLTADAFGVLPPIAPLSALRPSTISSRATRLVWPAPSEG